jgi:hypothetical protein
MAVGLVVGMLIGVGVGRIVDMRALGYVGGLALGVVLGLFLDDGDRGVEGDRDTEVEPEDGSIARALLWLVVGLLVLVGAAVATAPQLLQAPGLLSDVLLLVVVAGLPGVLLLVATIGRRRRIDRSGIEERR